MSEITAAEQICKTQPIILSAFQVCGNSISSISIPVPMSQCSQACSGNSSETCGNSWRMAIYQNPSLPLPSGFVPGQSWIQRSQAINWQNMGCYTDNNYPNRVLNGITISGDSVVNVGGGLTIELCQTYCVMQGFAYAAVEYSSQCCKYIFSSKLLSSV